MKPKRVDDEKLLKMLADDIPQKDIAKALKCAPSYITKRKRQLGWGVAPVEEPPTFATLTDQQKKFVIAKAEGKTNVMAVQDAYETTSQESAKSLGTTLMKNTSIQTSIAELMDLHGLKKEDRIKQLKTLVYSKDGNVSLKALDQTWKLDGSYAPERHVMEVDIQAIIARADYLLVELKRDGRKDEAIDVTQT